MNRGVLLPNEEYILLPGLTKAFETAMPEWLTHGKVKWDEATTLSFQLILQDNDRVLEGFPEGYMAFLKVKKLLPSCAVDQLGAGRIVKASDELLKEDHLCKHALLEAITCYLWHEFLSPPESISEEYRAALSG